MPLEFHQKTFDMLRLKPEICPKRSAELRSREAVLGRKFPKSVFEFFSLKDAEQIFAKNSNNDSLVPIEELGTFLEPRQIDHGWLCVASENQGVVHWMVRLGHGENHEDPEIWDTQDSWPVWDYDADLPVDDYQNIDWNLCADSFSDFIFEMLS
jgi:hypothetical protein